MNTPASPMPAAPAPETAATVDPALSWSAHTLLRHGQPHSIRSGSLHYFRVHPAQWRDRLLRLVDLGLNTVDTYIPWNFHQPRANTAPNFSGDRDLDRFLDLAAEVGLDVILRPGPYICAEWSNGGLPAWLTGRGISLRSTDPRFTDPVRTWFEDLLPRIVRQQASHGGPVIAVQVENEFGSFGDDAAYLEWLLALLRDSGITELLYTADGPTDLMFDGGSIPGVLAAATLGSKPNAARALLRERRTDEPFIVAEFWNGWFDHWGQPHHVRDAEGAAEAVADTLVDGGSISLYMAHGGTNFGLWAGANMVDGELRPTTTSYDSDAPIAEDGRLTEKFFALREVFGVADRPMLAPPVRLGAARSVALTAGPALLDVLRSGTATADSPVVPTFEDLGLDGGLVLYEASVLLPARAVELTLARVADRATVFVDDVPVGVITASGSITITGTGAHSRVSILVENLGRVNYGPALGEPKGLLGAVLVERRRVQHWTARAIELEPAIAATGTTRAPGAPGLSGARFDVAEPLDTHLTLPGFTKGFVWVNGFLLGRYWNIGPQETLYVPGPLLRAGENEITVLELHASGDALEFVAEPRLGPTEQYIEEF